ncbi:LysR family transcriptional regulator [Pectobacterium quasiaquaticum]|nr:LysR family transcriptional regulator [Pectobacterium quasiaquaticum]
MNDLNMLDLNDVALFVQVVRSGSFAEAARCLGMPPNTVSRRIQQLEEQLDTRLLQRSTRKLALTSVGQTFYDRCAGAVDGLTDAGQELLTGNLEPSGLVRVAAAADFFDFFSVEWVADFLAMYPLTRLDFVLSDARADLIGDRVDVAIRAGRLDDSGYISRQLLRAGYDGLVASPAYIAKHGMPNTLQDLAKLDCVSFGHPSGFTTWRLAGASSIEEDIQMSSRFSGNTIQALRKATLAGLGIALLPTVITRRDLHAGRLVPVLPQYKREGNGLHVLYPSRRHLPLAVSTFIAFLVGKFSTMFNTNDGSEA